jgi:lytic murein transglycosylase
MGRIVTMRLSTLFAAGVALVMVCLAVPAGAAQKKAPNAQERAFRQFVQSLWPSAEQRGVSRTIFDRAFDGVSFDPEIVAQTTQQAEFVRPIWDYVNMAVSTDRIERGRGKAQTFAPWLAKASETYGVDDGVILGIWGLESDFGAATGTDDVIRALASLAFICFRGDYFRDELLAALAILQHGDVKPRAMRGSWAGAMGQTQFMPSSYLVYAVDFERHGKRDIWSSAPDALGSTANYLAAHGWIKDLPWGFEVRLPAWFVLSDQDSSRPAAFLNFARRGVRRANGADMPKSGEGRLLIPAGLNGPIFLVTSNFDVIKAYNASTAYALSVSLLGDAIKGGGGLQASWPTRDQVLSVAEVRELQVKLQRLGYSVGDIDGMVGEALHAGVRAYQERKGMTPDGYANVALFKEIEAEAADGVRAASESRKPQADLGQCK